MAKKLSFTEIIQAEGTAGFEKLAVEDLERMIRERKIQSAYSHVQTLDEFYGIRWNPFHDTESYNEYSSLFEKGILSLEHDSLGELLQTINFFGKDTTVDMAFRENFKEEGEYFQALQMVKDRLDIDLKKYSPFFAQSIINDSHSLTAFVEEWYSAQSHEPRWNPSYAMSLQKKRLYLLLGTDQPEDWLEQLGAEHSFSQETDDFDEDGTHLGKIVTSRGGYLLLPFDGWTVAECFRRHYERR